MNSCGGSRQVQLYGIIWKINLDDCLPGHDFDWFDDCLPGHNFECFDVNVYCRKKGIVINVASASGMNPSPLLTIYSATKVGNLIVVYWNKTIKANNKMWLIRYIPWSRVPISLVVSDWVRFPSWLKFSWYMVNATPPQWCGFSLAHAWSKTHMPSKDHAANSVMHLTSECAACP